MEKKDLEASSAPGGAFFSWMTGYCPASGAGVRKMGSTN
jgi:hypothetical protein